jgi:cell division protease FtsH
MGHMRNYSESTAVEIDMEIRRIVSENHQRTRKLLTEHQDALIRIGEALLEKETLDGAEVRLLVFGEETAPVVEPAATASAVTGEEGTTSEA